MACVDKEGVFHSQNVIPSVVVDWKTKDAPPLASASSKLFPRPAPYLCSESACQEQSHCNGVFRGVDGENGQNDISMSLCWKNFQKGLLLPLVSEVWIMSRRIAHSFFYVIAGSRIVHIQSFSFFGMHQPSMRLHFFFHTHPQCQGNNLI